MDKYEIELTFLEELLGTVTKDKTIYSTYIASKAQLDDGELAEELETVPENEERGTTGFHQLDDGTPVLYDYVLKGFFKDACGMLRRATGTKSSKLSAYKKVIDGLVFVEPRRIPLELHGAETGVNERPLRASTAQGERVALAKSDTCPAGTTISFIITVLGSVSQVLLEEWLDYGKLRGLGQWRNAGFGRFEYTFQRLN